MGFEYQNSNWPELADPWNGAAAAPWGITRVNYPDGKTVAIDRDRHGKVLQAIISDSTNQSRIWSFTYDAYSNLTEERLQSGLTPNNSLDRFRRYGYDTNGNLEWREDAYAHRWTYEYSVNGQRTKATSPDGKVWIWNRDRVGNVTLYRNPIGYEQISEYTNRRQLWRLRDRFALGQDAVTEYRYNERGLQTTEIDPFQQLWRSEYSDSDELTAEIDPLGVSEALGYDHKGRLRTRTDGNGREVSYEYYDTALPGQAPQTTLPFNPLLRIRYPSFYEEYTFDLGSRPQRIRQVPETGTGKETLYRYWENDLLKEILRPDGEVLGFSWDILNRQASKTEPAIGTTTFTYPQGDSRKLYQDPVGGVVEQQFNQNGDLIREIRADQTEESFRYDARGNRSEHISSFGVRTVNIYDDANRLSEVRVYPNATASQPVRSVIYQYNLRGDLIQESDTGPEGSGVVQSYQRDLLGRVLFATTNYGPFSKTHGFTYRPNGTINTMTAVDGTVLQYLWDGANQFQGFTIPNEGTLSIGYLARWGAQPVTISYPGGSSQVREYNDLAELRRIRSTDQAGAVVMDYQYNLTNGPLEGPKINGITTEAGNYTFGYDLAFRLTSASLPDNTTEAYTYDGINRRQPASGTPWVYNQNGGVEATGAVTFSYDDNGNRSTRTESGVETSYRYSKDDRLIRIERPTGTTIAEYQYDYRGRRLKKQTGGATTYYYYSEDGLAAELDSSGAVIGSYYFAPGSMWTTDPLVQKSGSQYQYYHNDHLGTPQRLSDRTGAVTWRGRSKPYGELQVVSAAAGVVNNLRLPGQYFDQESGLNWNYQRNYDPSLGSYLEFDPMGMDEGANRYGYVGGNPLFFFDPEGLWPRAWDIYWEAHDKANEAYDQPGQKMDKGDTPKDAFRHCLASCVTATEYNQPIARFLGWANEKKGDWFQNQRVDSKEMDYFNNAFGRCIAAHAGDCPSECKRAADNDTLRKIDPNNRGPTYSEDYKERKRDSPVGGGVGPRYHR